MPTVEPWLRGIEPDVQEVGRAVLHALPLADEDLRKWCGKSLRFGGERAAGGNGTGGVPTFVTWRGVWIAC